MEFVHKIVHIIQIIRDDVQYFCDVIITNVQPNMIITGNSKHELHLLEEGSTDSCVTDPPYELGFMGKAWDSTGIAYDIELWKAVYRALKPGGYLLAFGGSRTYHRMACAIEDAGFEIRDQIMWVYGSGFPKSLNVGKAVDKLQGNEREDLGESPNHRVRNNNMKEMLSLKNPNVTKGTSEFEGIGTALKPAHEPICVARKPLSEKTVAENVLKWDTGGINIDATRVKTDEQISNHSRGSESSISKGRYGDSSAQETHQTNGQQLGRFPANLILDGSDVVKAMFPDQTSGAMTKPYVYQNNGFSLGKPTGETKQIHESNSGSASRFFKECQFTEDDYDEWQSEFNRLYYCAKTSKSERNAGLGGFEEKQQDTSRKEGNPGGDNPRNRGVNKTQNHHPTVKPISLMRYLCRLVTPKGGTVLDPFTGSGTTGIGAKLEGFDFVGIEMQSEYVEIAKARIEHWKPEVKITESQFKIQF